MGFAIQRGINYFGNHRQHDTKIFAYLYTNDLFQKLKF